ncbi:MAG: aminotransferase class V-fold PLP-dependent enzyme [Planctomycetes bacterium]|nr:aminotransferase class V-fold PLP-dependent enzyme [Planctomycetota bacterium]
MQFDVEFARSQFPSFLQPELAEWAFFENAGGSYVPHQVADRLDAFFRRCKVQPYGPFAASIEAGEAMDAGYRCIVELLNAAADEVTLGPSTTMNCYVLAQALRPTLKPGDELIITNQDHEANIGCWERLAEFGVAVKCWAIDPDSGELEVDALRTLVTDRTRLVCFSLCSNIVGTFQDVRAIVKVAHDAGALAIADGVSYAPHRVVDVRELGVDICLFSTYKTFGTHLGVLWGKREVLEGLAPQGHFFNSQLPRYRLNPAGPLHAEIAALAGVGEYYDALYRVHFGDMNLNRLERAKSVFELVADHETRLANQLLESLNELPDVRIVGQRTATASRRAPTISIVCAGHKHGELARGLAARKIAVRAGHFYALRCIRALGIQDPAEGVLRISMVHYNTEEEVRRLTDGLASLL